MRPYLFFSAILVSLCCIGCGKPAAPQSTAEFLAEVNKEIGAPAQSAETGGVPDLSSKGEPTIEVGTRTLDMGLISNSDFSFGSVPIYNRGTADLSIISIATTCACTEGEMREKTIKPGQQGELKVRITPLRVAGFESHKTLTLTTNDPKNPHVSIDVTAKVDPEFLLEPAILDFGTISKGTRVEKTLRFRALQQVKQADQTYQPITLSGTQIVGQAPGLETSVEPIPQEKWAKPDMPEALVKVTLNTNELPLGPYMAMFHVKNNTVRVPSLPVPTMGDVQSFYSVNPRSITIQNMLPGTTKEAVAEITATQPCTLESLSISEGYLSAKTRPGKIPNSFVVDLSLADGVQPGHKQEKIRFTLKSGDLTLSDVIPVFVIVGTPAGATPDKAPGASTPSAASN